MPDGKKSCGADVMQMQFLGCLGQAVPSGERKVFGANGTVTCPTLEGKRAWLGYSSKRKTGGIHREYLGMKRGGDERVAPVTGQHCHKSQVRENSHE